MTYERKESGTIALIGGTGKYKDIAGSGPGASPTRPATQLTFLFDYDVTWTIEGEVRLERTIMDGLRVSDHASDRGRSRMIRKGIRGSSRARRRRSDR